MPPSILNHDAHVRAIANGISTGELKVEKALEEYGPETTSAALNEIHDNFHRLWRRCADDESCEVIAGMHADVVNELYAQGWSHPPQPTDDLDETLEMDPTEGPPPQPHQAEMSIGIRKALGEQRIVYGVVLEPMVTDAQEEWERPAMIERTAHGFLASYNAGTKLGVQHRIFGEIGVELVESYIAPQDLDFDGELASDQIIRKGSWVMVVHVTSDDLWRRVKDGSITGFSVGGTATILAEPG